MGHNGSPWGRSGVLRGGGGVPRLPTGVTAVSPWGSSRPPSHQRSRTGGLLGALLHARLSVPFSATVGDPKIVTSAGRSAEQHGPLWGSVGLCGALWGGVGLYGAVWGCMGLCGAV